MIGLLAVLATSPAGASPPSKPPSVTAPVKSEPPAPPFRFEGPLAAAHNALRQGKPAEAKQLLDKLDSAPVSRQRMDARKKAVLALIDSDFITGETLRVDGGRHVR